MPIVVGAAIDAIDQVSLHERLPSEFAGLGSAGFQPATFAIAATYKPAGWKPALRGANAFVS